MNNHVKPAGGTRSLTRRGFLKTAAVAAASVPMAGAASLLGGCRSELGDEIFLDTRKIVDHAGRELSIPTAGALERIYYTSPLAQIYVLTLDPSKMAGTAAQYSSKQLAYLPEEIHDLLYMGSLADGGQIDREMLMQQDVQLVFSISAVGLTAANISDAQGLQDATGIPVVLVDGSFENITEAYRFIGDIMGCEKRAKELADYLEGIYDDVTSAVAGVADEDRVSLYYAEGPLGLSTEPSSSQHAQVFEAVRARNVADVDLTGLDVGMSAVSLESVIKWNPEVIISWNTEIEGGAYDIIRTSADWAGIDAVKNGRVYSMSTLPFAWCDRPPGVNRWLGLQWVANMLYPELYDVDMVDEVRKFYSFVYQIEVTDDQILEMLGNSYPPYRA